MGVGDCEISCHGMSVDFFDAGAKPSFIAAIGSGYRITLVKEKSAR